VSPAAPAARRAVGPLWLALWIGLAGGLGESALFFVKRFVLHYYTRMSYQNLWMAPLDEALLLLVPGLLLWIAVKFRPGLRWWQSAVAVGVSLAIFGMLLYAYQLHMFARVILAVGVGVQTGRLAERHRDRAQALVRRTLPLQLALTALIGVTVNGYVYLRERRAIAGLPAARAGAPNILLLILDTVRAPDLSVYGYGRPTTPFLERLAARGVLFERAIAAAPWTLPSHASIFTGRPAHELSANWRTRLDGQYRTLAEALSAHGYLTAGFAANQVYTSDESGLARGFAHYDAVRVTPGSMAISARVAQALLETETFRSLSGLHDLLWRRRADEVRRSAADWLAAHPGRPWFAFVNLYDAHNPYLPPAPYDTLFGGRKPWDRRNLWLQQTAPVTPAAIQVERDAYDDALAYLDHEIGAMLDDFRSRGLLENTIVIVTADHGEEFGEHGLLDHGNSLYLPALHVPLLVVWPGHVPAGRRVEPTVSLIDLAATVLDLAAADTSFAGRSLRPLWGGADSTAWDPAVASVRHATGLPAWFPVSRGDMGSVVTDRYQLIRDAAGADSVFDLGLDPLGMRPAASPAGIVAELQSRLPPQR